MTYEYACQACGHHWEAEQSIKDAPLKSCTACGADKAKRLVSGGSGFLLKGGGWYADLYSSKPAGGASSGESPAAKASSGDAAASGKSDTKTDGAKSSASSESKPAKPAETKVSSAPST